MNEDNRFTLKDLLPYASTFIVFLGVLRLIVFYSQFGIHILNFLEFSEIVTSFLDIIVLIVFFIFCSMIQGLLFDDEESNQRYNEIRNELFNEKRIGRRIVIYFKYLSALLIFCALVILGILIWCYFDRKFDIYQLFQAIIFSLGLISFVILITEAERKHKNKQSSVRYRQIITIAIYAITFSVIDEGIAGNEVHQMKVKKSQYGIVVHLDSSKVFKSDSNSYYIGNTKGYLFIYHQKEDVTDVFPMSKIKSISFLNRTK